MQNYIKRKELTQIKIEDISYDLPDLKNIKESKAVIIGKWIIDWLKNDIKSGKIQFGTLLPSKPDMAYLLGVSVGTIQSALRYVEDFGYIESKQCIGSVVKDCKDTSSIRKLTSKREIAIEKIKKYIISNDIKEKNALPSSRIIAEHIGVSPNTVRFALEYLCSVGIIKHKFKNSKEIGWILKNRDFEVKENVEAETLVLKIKSDLCDYIIKNLKVGDKMPSHLELSEIFKVSIKTVHDALDFLIKDGIILAKRGRYGSTIIRMPNEIAVEQRRETSIFASAQETAFYYYEKTQNRIKKMIADSYTIGSKLPSIKEISQIMDLSPNTIRKALHNLAKEGYLVFSRGKYGGTFVIDIPQMEEQPFKWLAVNPKYAKIYSN